MLHLEVRRSEPGAGRACQQKWAFSASAALEAEPVATQSLLFVVPIPSTTTSYDRPANGFAQPTPPIEGYPLLGNHLRSAALPRLHSARQSRRLLDKGRSTAGDWPRGVILRVVIARPSPGLDTAPVWSTTAAYRAGVKAGARTNC